MKIKEIFKDEMKELTKAIDEMTQEHCIKKFCSYVCSLDETISTCEQGYIDVLKENFYNFVVRLHEKKLDNLSKEQLLEEAIDYVREGKYGLSEMSDEEYYDVICGLYTDIEAFPFIKTEMLNILWIYKKRLNQTKNDFELAQKESQINKLDSSLEYHLSNINRVKRDFHLAKEEINNFFHNHSAESFSNEDRIGKLTAKVDRLEEEVNLLP